MCICRAMISTLGVPSVQSFTGLLLVMDSECTSYPCFYGQAHVRTLSLMCTKLYIAASECVYTCIIISIGVLSAQPHIPEHVLRKIHHCTFLSKYFLYDFYKPTQNPGKTFSWYLHPSKLSFDT